MLDSLPVGPWLGGFPSIGFTDGRGLGASTGGVGLAHIERSEKADKSAQDHRISAGLRFKELKGRVSIGKAGQGVSWAAYCAQHVPTLTQRTVERYIAIADGKASNVGEGGGGTTSSQPCHAEEEAMRKADFQRAMEGAGVRSSADGVKFDPETAFTLWRMGRKQPDSVYARTAWNVMCNDFNKGRGKVWDGVTDAPYHIWRKARGFPDDAMSRAMWAKGDVDGNRSGAGVDDTAKSSTASAAEARKGEDPEKRKARQKGCT